MPLSLRQVTATLSVLGVWTSLPESRPLAAQRLRVDITSTQRLAAVDMGIPIVEPHLAVHPDDSSRWLAGAIVVGPGAEDPWTCAVLWTDDAGRNWRKQEFAFNRCIDPWVTFDAEGKAHFLAIEIRPPGGAFRLHLASRSMEGDEWLLAQPVGDDHDHAMLLPTSDGRLFLASRVAIGNPDTAVHNLWVAMTDSNGERWTTTQPTLPAGRPLQATGIVTSGDGAPVVSWMIRGEAFAARADSLDSPHLITDRCADMISAPFPGYPALAGSGGTVYHACISGEDRSVLVSRSSDRGTTWSSPLRLGTRAPRGTARTPMLAALGSTIAVAWREFPDSERPTCQHVMVTVSVDNAETFTVPTAVSPPACLDEAANGRAARSWPMGGDYGSLAALPDGEFLLIWADPSDGPWKLTVTRFRAEFLPPSDSPVLD